MSIPPVKKFESSLLSRLFRSARCVEATQQDRELVKLGISEGVAIAPADSGGRYQARLA